MSWSRCVVLLVFAAHSSACGALFHDSFKHSADAARIEYEPVRVVTEPPGASLYLIEGNEGTPQMQGVAPTEVLVPYEVRGGAPAASLVAFAVGGLIDLALTGGLVYYTANTEDSKILPSIGIGIMGLALLADLGTLVGKSRKPEIKQKDVMLMARLANHVDTKERLKVPGTAEVRLALPESAAALAKKAAEEIKVVRRALGKMLVLEVRAGRGLPGDLTKLITSVSASELQRHNEDDVLGLSDVDAMLKAERVKDALGCSDTACFAEIGGQLGTKLVLAGDVERAGSFLVFSYRLIDTRGAVVAARYSHREEVQGDVEDALIRSIPAAIAGLLGSLK